MHDWIGWLATAVFASSYFCKRAITLRSIQSVAAVVWVAYGVLIGAWPVIGANVVVGALAAFSAWRGREHRDAVSGRKLSSTIVTGTGVKGSAFPLRLHQPATPKPRCEVE
jgi:hypothetical protein